MYPKPPYVDLHNGMGFQIVDGKKLLLGKDLMSGQLNHYRITRDFEWEILPGVPFRFK
jgi:hypothetical protein